MKIANENVLVKEMRVQSLLHTGHDSTRHAVTRIVPADTLSKNLAPDT